MSLAQSIRGKINNMDDVLKIAGSAIAGGVVSGIGATVSMKVDQAGIKQTLLDHERRLGLHEASTSRIEASLAQVREDLAKIKGALGVEK